MKNNKKGFTLIELMIVVAIIGILAAIAIPKFADLINKSKEGATKGSLSSVRSALQVYYGDNEGWFPTDNLSTTLTANAKYINAIPVAKLPGTGLADSAAVATFSSSTVAGVFQGGGTPNVGGWAYFNDSTASSQWGTFVVNSTAQDIKGDGVWSSF
jgi:prepilin-type N-terminal cleavage/methylation domain-containing protein